MKKTEIFAEFKKMEALSEFISREGVSSSDEPVDRIIRELDKMVSEMRQKFQREALNQEILEKGLFEKINPRFD